MNSIRHLMRCRRLLAGSVLAALMASAWGAGSSTDNSAGSRAESSALQFDITRFEVSGNSLLPQPEVDAVLGHYTGKGRSIGDVQAAREALAQAYRVHGYKLVTVALPEQELDAGVVRLRVVETRIGRVTIRNNRHFDDANIRRSLPALQEGSSPDLETLSANLRQANESPARQVTVKLQSSEQAGQVDADLEVKDQSPWRVMASAANTGTANTGRTQVAVALQQANLFGRDHLATLQYITSAEKPGSVKVWGAGYHIPFYASGDSLDLYASYSNVDSGTVNTGLFDLAVNGKGAVYGARYNQALTRGTGFESKLSYGLEVKAFKSSIQLVGIELGNDVTVRPVSLSYQATAPITSGEVSGLVSLVRNLPGGPNGNQDAFTLARANSTANYTLLRASGSITRALAGDWQLRAIANGQYTGDALIPGEQFGIGGATSVRGFQEREFANDSGLTVNLEAYTPNLCSRDGWNCRLLAFYDAGHVSRNKALPGELSSTTIVSVGLGVRFVLSTYANLQMDYGHVTRAGVSPPVDSNRLHVRLALAY